jgi:thiamine pyrophosphokinase
MNTPICHLVGAGSFCKELFSPQKQDLVIACDAGLRHLASIGMLPHFAVGDFDSFAGDPSALLPEDRIVRLPREKDDTDSLYALRLGLEKGYRCFLLHGSLGGERFSHALANLSLLSFLERQGAQGTLVGQNLLVFRKKEGSLLFEKQASGYLSIFADEKEARIVLEGLKYEYSGILYHDLPVGVSNEFKSACAKISVLGGTVTLVAEGQHDPLFFFKAAERAAENRGVEG